MPRPTESTPAVREPVPQEARAAGLRARCERYAVPLLAAIFFVAYAPVFYREYEISQWTLYCKAAQRLSAHETINVFEGNMYSYPPAMAMLSIPLANLPPWASHGAWYLVNVLATCVTFYSAWQLMGGPSLVGLAGHWRWILTLGLILAGRHLLSPLENQQYDMVIAAFLLAGCLALSRGLEWQGGSLMGIGAAMKLTPALFLPYLVWRGRPKAAAAMVVAMVALNVSPDLFWPQSSGNSYLADWKSRCLSSVVEGPPGQWLGGASNVLNQSLAGMVTRAWVNGFPTQASVYKQERGLSPDSARHAKWFLYSLELVLAGLTAWVMGRPFRSTPTVPADGPRPVPFERLQLSLECSMVLALMVLFSPMSSKAHYAPLLLPSLLLARLAVERRSRMWVGIVVLLAMVGPLATKGILGGEIGVVALGWGVPTCYAILVLLGCWGAALAINPPAHDARPTTPPGTHWHLSRRVREEQTLG